MLVRDLMSHRFESIDYKAAVRNAAKQMRDLDIGMLPVNENGEIVGTVTDRDITVRVTANGSDPNTTLVADIMSNEVYACTDDDTLEEAARLMEMHQLHRLMVTNTSGKFVGILSLADIARSSVSERLVAEIVEGVSQPMH